MFLVQAAGFSLSPSRMKAAPSKLLKTNSLPPGHEEHKEAQSRD
jgi:hypothetical protein